MKKTIINPIILTAVFSPLCGDIDAISEAYGDTYPNDENAVKVIIRDKILPDTENLKKQNPNLLNRMKATLQYALSLPSDRVQWKKHV